MNLDFDVIDVTFANGRENTVIPVVANPIDVVPRATPPVETKSDKQVDWRLIVVAVALLALSIVFLPQILFGLAKGVIKLVGKLLKGIGGLFKGGGNDKE